DDQAGTAIPLQRHGVPLVLPTLPLVLHRIEGSIKDGIGVVLSCGERALRMECSDRAQCGDRAHATLRMRRSVGRRWAHDVRRCAHGAAGHMELLCAWSSGTTSVSWGDSPHGGRRVAPTPSSSLRLCAHEKTRPLTPMKRVLRAAATLEAVDATTRSISEAAGLEAGASA